MNPTTFNAVKKAGVVYFCGISSGEYPRTISGPWSVNGTEAKSCNYGKDWYKAEWPVKEIAKWQPPREDVHRFVLKPELVPSPTLPAEVAPARWGGWPDEEWPGGMQQFYDTDSTKIPGTWVPIEYDLRLVDDDCEPRTPKYAGTKMQLPFGLEYNPVSWHKYPCYLGGDDLYKVIWDYVVPRIPAGCSLSSGIFSGSSATTFLEIKKTIPVIHEEMQNFTREEGRGRSKRVRSWREPLRELSLGNIVNYGTAQYRQGHPQPETITGQNADDLESKVQAFLDGILAKLGEPLRVCDKCHGYGITDNEGKALK
jgi:hypothetical protein